MSSISSSVNMHVNVIAQSVVQRAGLTSPSEALGKGIKELQQGLQQLKSLLGELAKSFSGASPQAPSQPPAFSPSKVDPRVMANPQQTIINIQINFGQAQGSNAPLKSFPLMPESSGAPGSFAAAANVVSSRVTGSNKAQYTFDANGPWGAANKDEKVAVAHAMYKNPNVQFDSDTKRFFVTGTDGSRRDVATLDEVVNAGRKTGEFTTHNGAAITEIAKLLEGKISSPAGTTSQAPASGPAANAPSTQAAQSNPLQEIMDLLKKLLEMLSGKAGGAQGASAGAASGSTGSGAAAGTGDGIAAGGSTGSAGGTSPMADSGGWGKIDSMMAQAEKLAMSDKPSDQLKAQKMMQQAQQMFQTISKLLQQLMEMFKTSMGNVR